MVLTKCTQPVGRVITSDCRFFKTHFAPNKTGSDLMELVEAVQSRTVMPIISEKDIVDAKWMLTRGSFRYFIRPKDSISKYPKIFSDYNNKLNGEILYLNFFFFNYTLLE